jgi:hypothetical protein
MMPETSAMIAFGFLALLLLFIGSRRGFFQENKTQWVVPIQIMHLLGAFTIYFFFSALIPYLALNFFQKQIMLNYMGFSSWLNFGSSTLIFLMLVLYWMSWPPKVKWGILRKENSAHPPMEDIWAALYAWLLAFPLVLFISQALEFFVTKIFHITIVPEQIAVKFLKSTFENPVYFVLAILSITVLAPLLEESLFRGFLQTFIRKHLGRRQAILITSVCFALFHYSAGQGLGNISIIIPLFILALFLGFLYEKQESLLAPVALHATFNTVSVINLYLFGGFTSGL